MRFFLMVFLLFGCGYHLGNPFHRKIHLVVPVNKTEYRGVEMELHRLLVAEIRKSPGFSLSSTGVEIQVTVERCRGIPVYEEEKSPTVGDFYVQVTVVIFRSPAESHRRTLEALERYDTESGISLEAAKSRALTRLAQSIVLEILTSFSDAKK
ncbi:MAG: hypothetical protein N2234_06695 [Planctomycetota bacterium]|nr:hypothetical protein [Planctomycetota bacterium]